MKRIAHAPECAPTIAAFIEWIKKYEDEMRTIHTAFVEAIKKSPFAHVNETGLPLDGKNWWLWCIVATEVALYLPSDTRGSNAIKDIFHEYKGILLSDFWTAYNKLDAEQQKCLEHVVRELRKISLRELEMRDKVVKQLEQDAEMKEHKSTPLVSTLKKRGRPAKQPAPLSEEERRILEVKKAQCEKASQQAVKFIDFFKNAWNKEGHPMSVFTPFNKRMRTSEAEALLKALIAEIKAEGPATADIQRLIERFEKYGSCLLTYLDHPDVMPDNNTAEREIPEISLVLR
ncbi:MAG: IS66 family transposase [Candidatus Helarchaeota archaeon]